jgi:photosystem II stability/assembly factor-like uncharacterized protein
MNKHWLTFSGALLGLTLSAPALQFTNVTQGAFTAPQTAVAYDGVDTIVSVASDGSILSSTFVDGTAWEVGAGARTNVPGGVTLNSVLFGGDGFVAGGADANVYRSSDKGVNWSQGPDAFPSPVSVQGLAYNLNVTGGPRFVAVAGTFAASYATNTPPTNWTAATIPSPVLFESYRGVTANGSDRFALCGVLGNIRVSTNGGTSWTVSKALDVNAQNLLGIAWNGAQTLVAVGNQGTILYNTNNGSGTWLTAASGTTASLGAVAYTGTEFIAAGDGGLVLTSANGVTWTSNTTAGVTGNLRGIAVGQTGKLSGLLVLVGNNGTVVLGGDPPAAPVSAGNQFICAEQPAPALTVTVANSSYITADWFDAASGGTLLHPGSLSFNPSNALPGTVTTYYAQARDLRTGFVSTNRTAVTLTVNAIIVVNVATDALVCAGESYALNGSASGGTPGYTYSWLPTNFLSNPTIANPIATPPPGTTNIYTLVVTDSVGCAGTNSLTLRVNPVITVTVAPNGIGLCR